MSEWIDVNTEPPPKDGSSFFACIWGEWVGQCIYARHYDAGDRCPGKYEFYYVTQNPEDEGWRIKFEERPFPITHWMPLPEPPEKEENINDRVDAITDDSWNSQFEEKE